MKPKSSTPHLNQLLQDAHIFKDGTKYIGRAADGTEVFLGEEGGEEALESYLRAYPTAQDW